MVQNLWIPQNRKTTLCIDSYDRGVLCGRFYSAGQAAETFDSLSQFLVKMDAILEEYQMPQSYTSARSFSEFLLPEESNRRSVGGNKGKQATFELQVLFRQHTSWQGILVWQDRKLEQSFRSVLELVLLIDSALRSLKGKEAS